MTALRSSLNLHSSKFEKILILGDFNVEVEEENMKSFCENYNLKFLTKQSICYENPNKPICIDLILTNVWPTLESTCVLEIWRWFSSNDGNSYEEKIQENESSLSK